MTPQELALRLRPATPEDQPFLLEMLYHAANLAGEGALDPRAALANPWLAVFVVDWGRPGDLGVIAERDGTSVGAAWLRVFSGPDKHYEAVADGLPELAIAVTPALVGQGIGAQLLGALLAAARGQHQAVVLSVREGNPAQRLYERAGFVVVDTIINRVGGRSFVMRCDL